MQDGSYAKRALDLADSIGASHPLIESVTAHELDGDTRITVNLLPAATDRDAHVVWCDVLLPLEARLAWLTELSVEPTEDLQPADRTIELVYWPRPDRCGPEAQPAPLVGETLDGDLVSEPRLVPARSSSR